MTPLYAERAAKPITPTQAECAQWLTENTGYRADVRTVALLLSLRAVWQRSEGHQAILRAARQQQAAEAERRAAAARDLLKNGRPRKEPDQCNETENGERCPVKGTSEQPLRKGKCPKHYQRARRNGTLPRETAAPEPSAPRRAPSWP